MYADATLEGSTFAAASAPARGAVPHGRLRLTRRGRAVFGTLGTLLVSGLLAFSAVLGATSANASAETGEQEFGYVVVPPGASLWSIASSIDPQSDPRDLVSEIVSLNSLEGSGVQAGQPVAVPLRYADAPGVVSESELQAE